VLIFHSRNTLPQLCPLLSRLCKLLGELLLLTVCCGTQLLLLAPCCCKLRVQRLRGVLRLAKLIFHLRNSLLHLLQQAVDLFLGTFNLPREQ
jgi:hypothetical protein